MKVRVADKGQLVCNEVIQQFSWKMQGITFMAYLLLLPLGGWDIMLEVQRLSGLGAIL